MAPPAANPAGSRLRASAAGLLMLVFLLSGCAVIQPRQEAYEPPAEEGGPQRLLERQLSEARSYFEQGRYDLSKQVLKSVADPANPEIQYLQAQIALAQGDTALAAFHLKMVLSGGIERLDGEKRQEVYRLLADLSYAGGDLDTAYRHYLQTVNMAGGRVDARTWIRLAEIAFFHRADSDAARVFLQSYRSAHDTIAADPPAEGRGLADRLARRLRWRALEAGDYALADANVSALQADGDDLWIGTWNGGISRYSIAKAEATVFEPGGRSLVPQTVRSIEVTDKRVWIGTYQGLFRYTKASSRWQRISAFQEKVEALCSVRGVLYAGTLGRGLWRLHDGRWQRIGGSVLPGDFINCLAATEEHLLIGTMTLGLVILDLRNGRFHSFDSVNPDLAARNVITLLAENEHTLWIGTYGEGLYRWDRRQNTLQHFSKAGGQLADDWVLCSLRTRSGLYFGTFGGGVSRYRTGEGTWERIGLREGLSALDIGSSAYTEPLLFFGTLGSGISMLDESLVHERENQ